jgi:hypothetical protein
LFGLQQALDLYEFYQKQLRDCEAQIGACLRSMKDRSDGRPLPPSLRQRKPEKNEVRFGARALLFRMSGVDLTQIEGISETTALVILSELGIDLSAFPHEKNFVSWLGLCPQHRGSGGGRHEVTPFRVDQGGGPCGVLVLATVDGDTVVARFGRTARMNTETFGQRLKRSVKGILFSGDRSDTLV